MIKNNLVFSKILSVKEDFMHNYRLNFISKFNNISSYNWTSCIDLSLNFGFKQIRFEKKQMVLFFMLLELISHQKCILTKSRKNIAIFKIKRGFIVGCKVNLRNNNFYSFLDTLILVIPRSEIFKGFLLKKNSNKLISFSLKLKELFIFYPIEFENMSFIKFLDLTFKFNTINNFEKEFFFTHNKIPLQYL
jgi:large subunit ribosomal protein L5